MNYADSRQRNVVKMKFSLLSPVEKYIVFPLAAYCIEDVETKHQFN